MNHIHAQGAVRVDVRMELQRKEGTVSAHVGTPPPAAPNARDVYGDGRGARVRTISDVKRTRGGLSGYSSVNVSRIE